MLPQDSKGEEGQHFDGMNRPTSRKITERLHIMRNLIDTPLTAAMNPSSLGFSPKSLADLCAAMSASLEGAGLSTADSRLGRPGKRKCRVCQIGGDQKEKLVDAKLRVVGKEKKRRKI